MRRLLRFAMPIIIIALWILAAPVRAGRPPGAQAPPAAWISYQAFQLANGLKVYVIEDRKAPMVYEVLWFKVGSKDEVAGCTGFAHFV